MFNSDNGYSLADLATVSRGNNGAFGDSSGAWWIIILFLFCFMGGGNGFFGGYGVNAPATATDVQNDFNFASLERQNQGIVDAVHQAAYDVTGAVKDTGAFTQSVVKDLAYNLNTELKDNAWTLGQAIRDVKEVAHENNYEVNKGFAAVNQNIDSIRYDNAINTRELLASNAEQTQKILDTITGNRIADMQNQINQLQLQSALCGVVRYPLATTYNAGYSPYFNTGFPCNCNG